MVGAVHQHILEPRQGTGNLIDQAAMPDRFETLPYTHFRFTLAPARVNNQQIEPVLMIASSSEFSFSTSSSTLKMHCDPIFHMHLACRPKH